MNSVHTFLFVGGGSLGHVLPSLAVAQELRHLSSDSRILFICSERPEEARRITNAGHAFHTLRAPSSSLTGLSAFALPFRFLGACMKARRVLLRERPSVIFAKGGSVSVPVGLMGWMLRIPLVIHESDCVQSLSTRILSRFSKVMCGGFPEIGLSTAQQQKFWHTGNPVRREIMTGSRAAAQRITGFSGKRPVLLIIGGSQGSVALNNAVVSSLEALLDVADIIHLTGAGKMTAKTHARYFARASMSDALPHLYALADIVLSRSGAGVLSEMSALQKVVITVPLTGVGHDHQLNNALFLEKNNAVILLPEQELSRVSSCIKQLLSDADIRKNLGESLLHAFPKDAAKNVAEILLAEASGARIQS